MVRAIFSFTFATTTLGVEVFILPTPWLFGTLTFTSVWIEPLIVRAANTSVALTLACFGVDPLIMRTGDI